MKTQRPFRAAIWPLAVASLLAVGFALANPEARQPSPLAHHLKQTEHLVAFRTVDDERPTIANSTPPAAPTIGLQPQPSIKPATRPAVATEHSQPDRILAQSTPKAKRSATPARIIPRATPVEITSSDDTLTTARSTRSPAIFIESSHTSPPRTQSLAASQHKPMVSLGPVIESPENANSELPTVQPAQVKRPTKGVARRSVNSASQQRDLPTSTATEIAGNDNRDRKETNELALLTAALAGRMDSSRLETHLVNLQRQIDQLTQKQDQDQSQSLQRTVQLLEKLEQTSQLQELQRRLDQLQNALPKTPTETTPTASSEGTHPKESDEKSASKSSSAPTPNPGPILKAEPKGGDLERLNLTIQDAEITEVLKMLGEISQVNILVGKGVKGKVSANLQEVTVEQALAGILRSLDCMFEREGRFIFVMTAAEADARKKAGRKLITKVYRPNYISVADLQSLVTPLLTAPVGKVAVTLPAEIGISPDNKTAGGNRIAQQDALLVMDYPEVIQEIDSVLLEMDVPPLQVVIETMILSVSLNDSMEFGVNFALLSGKNKDLFLNGNGRTLNGGSGFPGTGTGSIVPPGTQFLADTAGLKYGFLRGDMAMFLNALEEIADTNVIASPQLRVLNKQKAELIIGEKLSYTTTTFNQTQTIENVQFLDVGTKLVLRPFIAPDGMVRMEIHPERSSGSINPQTQLPDLETTEVTTNVMVRDGSTVVIGGLIDQKTEETQQRIPYLGAIPLIGNAFKNKSEKQTRTELILLITPRVVSEPEDAMEGDAARFENEERADHFRDNLSPVNRRNLGRMEYERALDLFEQRDLVRARTHIYRALRHSKNDLDALRLRDQIEDALHSNTRRILSFGTMNESAAEPLPLPPPADGEDASIGTAGNLTTPFSEVEPSGSAVEAESSGNAGELEAIFDLPPSPRRASKTVPKVQ